ncbi:SET domain bifurcated histone lysine methyltransferase eggless [Anticarsia gemmatalis]|uniref:SET domain bifurcated histone lysine methyltransferase eggless n=1 Tax=Anticarsia gemmatalis TaxID=129554 RepID=UPI003F75AC91
MSGTDDLNSNKDKAELLKEDIANLNTGNTPEVNISSNIGGPKPGENAETTLKNLEKDSVRDTTDNLTDVLNQNVTLETSKMADVGKGSGDTANDNEPIAKIISNKPNLVGKDTYKNTEQNMKEIENVEDIMEDDDLELKWDDEETNTITKQPTTEKETSEIRNPEEIKKILTETEISSNKLTKNVEENLLEDISENSISENIAMDINEDELLDEETAMDEDINLDANTELITANIDKPGTSKQNVSISHKKNIENLNKTANIDSQVTNSPINVINSVDNSPIHIKTDHRLHQPNVMLDIPTQELIDIDDVSDCNSQIDDDMIGDENEDGTNGNNIEDGATNDDGFIDAIVNDDKIDDEISKEVNEQNVTEKGDEIGTSDVVDKAGIDKEVPEDSEGLELLVGSEDNAQNENTRQIVEDHSEDSNPNSLLVERVQNQMPEAEESMQEGPEKEMQELEEDLQDASEIETVDNEIMQEGEMQDAETVRASETQDNEALRESEMQDEEDNIVKTEEFSSIDIEEMKLELKGKEGGKTDRQTKPILPDLTLSTSEPQVKTEQEKPVRVKRTPKVTTKAVSSTTNEGATENDDVIEQAIEIETVCIDSSEDEEDLTKDVPVPSVDQPMEEQTPVGETEKTKQPAEEEKEIEDPPAPEQECSEPSKTLPAKSYPPVEPSCSESPSKTPQVEPSPIESSPTSLSPNDPSFKELEKESSPSKSDEIESTANNLDVSKSPLKQPSSIPPESDPILSEINDTELNTSENMSEEPKTMTLRESLLSKWLPGELVYKTPASKLGLMKSDASKPVSEPVPDNSSSKSLTTTELANTSSSTEESLSKLPSKQARPETDSTETDPSKSSSNEASNTPSVGPSSIKSSSKLPADSSPVVSDENKLPPKPSSSRKSSLSESSPSKLKNLAITKQSTNLNIVDLEESSSEDDMEVNEPSEKKASRMKRRLLDPPESSQAKTPVTDEGVTSVNLPPGIEIMTSGVGGTSEIVTKEGEVVISGVPKPPPQKPARLNTDEVTIKTTSSTEPTLVIPETAIKEPGQAETSTRPRMGLEIFSLDSDEEDSGGKDSDPKPQLPELVERRWKCINSMCTSGVREYIVADGATAAYYDASKKRRPMVCRPCADALRDRKQKLVTDIKNMVPLLQLDMSATSQDLVEVLDSDSEDDDQGPMEHDDENRETIGEETAKFLEDNLGDLFNDTWKKYNLEERLKETQDELNAEIDRLQKESMEINTMLVDCQRTTDKLRFDFYATFEQEMEELPPLLIYETPDFKYIGPDMGKAAPAKKEPESRLVAKRKLAAASSNQSSAKRPAIPLGYASLEDSRIDSNESRSPIDYRCDSAETRSVASTTSDTKSYSKSDASKSDDDKDISVVKLSAESAPADLPPPGELSRPPLRVGMNIFAMKNAFGPWFKGKITEIVPKGNSPNAFTMCRVKFEHKMKTTSKVLPARCIAYAEPADVRMTIGTRVIALFKASTRDTYYSGVIAEIPNPVNSYRYLVFFDDGYAQYVKHRDTRIVAEFSPLVWEEVHPFSREFVREYLMAYPERPMVRLHEGQSLKTEWNGKWWSSTVLKVDASLAQVMFVDDGRREWVYRGSTRLAPLFLELAAAERHTGRPRPMPRTKQLRQSDMPYVEYTRSDGQAKTQTHTTPQLRQMTREQQEEELRRQRAVAKKSTAIPLLSSPYTTTGPSVNPLLEGEISRVVYYTPKNAVRPHKFVPHACGPRCKRTDVLTLRDLRTYNPLAKPLLSGWERQIIRYKGQKEVMYRGPCGRRLRNMKELHRYLRMTQSELPVDLFDFHYETHCLAEFVLSKCITCKKDLSHGKENVPVPCANYQDESLPEFCSYNTERTPTSGVPLNLDPEFLCGCDCTDDCEDKTKCACWKLTLEGARTIGLDGPNVGYEYKRLPEPLPSGIYECNSRCKCKNTCLNRVAQHPLQLKLQVFKTKNRGWGIRALNDVPKGAFLCVYAGNLLTDATANLDGLNEGDEYLAELDYIEVVEQMKEGYEEDIPEADKKLDKQATANQEETEGESSASEEDETASKTDKEDDDFRPGYIGLGVMEFNKRLRKREKSKKGDKEQIKSEKEKDKDTEESIKEENKDSSSVKDETSKDNTEEDCITISDDEEVREPSRFTAQPGMGATGFVSKYKSVRALFGEDEACYIMDAKVQGNIGRYLNHSCSPNVFVQNVFVDTHDPRFPWVAFFALSLIKAGSELTWNYNYDVGSVPGKVLYCLCEAPNCRGRLL